MIEPTSLSIVKQAHESLQRAFEESGDKMPENSGAKRELDCAVIKYLHEIRRRAKEKPFDTVRSPFHEAGLLYPTSNFTARLHIEICVIEEELIKGYFIPFPIDEYNPYLNKEFVKEKK